MKKSTIPRQSTYISMVFPKQFIIIALDLATLLAAWKTA